MYVCVYIMFKGIIYVQIKSCNLPVSCVHYHFPPTPTPVLQIRKPRPREVK